MPVIDASVAIKWFVEEPGSPAAHHLLEAHKAGHSFLVAPDLLIYEVANALLHNPTFTAHEVQRCLEHLYELEVDLVAPLAELVIDTVRLAAAKRLSFYDALYVQLARHLELPFYTADRRLITKLPDHPLIHSL